MPRPHGEQAAGEHGGEETRGYREREECGHSRSGTSTWVYYWLRPVAAGGTIRNLSSWPLDPVVHDLSRFAESFGGSCERRRGSEP